MRKPSSGARPSSASARRTGKGGPTSVLAATRWGSSKSSISTRSAIPDRPGNNRFDSLANIVANPSVGLLFIVPGFDDTLRVNGRASLVTDPEILEPMEVYNRRLKLAILVRVSEVFLHCAKAFRRSHLWNPEHFQDRRDMPSLSKIILDQTTGVRQARWKTQTRCAI